MDKFPKKETLKVVNSILLVVLIFSVASISDVRLTGQFYAENEAAECSYVENGEEKQVPIDRCCLFSDRKLVCSEKKGETFCTDTNDTGYYLNHEAVKYCEREGFNIE